MYVNCGYLNPSLQGYADHSHPMVVICCGEYRLKTRPFFQTVRPDGWQDYQLLYVAAGKAHFVFEGQEQVLSAGSLFLYRPGQAQHYWYRLEDQPDICWVHFTGSQAEPLLKKYNLFQQSPAMSVGTLPEIKQHFQLMIRELQLRRPYFEESLAALMNRLLLLAGRQQSDRTALHSGTQEKMEEAVAYFHAHFSQDLRVDAYARSLHISTAWFIHAFTRHTGQTPNQYLLSLRIASAQSLLEQTGDTVTEIAASVGYDNPLYFSRLFKKQTGLSPRQYREKSARI